MAKSLYEQLRVADDASIEVIRHACMRTIAGLQQRCDAGDEKARDEVAALKQGFEILSSPARRAAYDLSIERDLLEDEAETVEDSPGFWSLSKIMVVVVIVCALGVVGYYRGEAKKAEAAAATEAENRKRAELLVEQQRELKERDRTPLVISADPAEVARQQAEIKRLQEYSREVGNETAMAERALAIEAQREQKQKKIDDHERKLQEAEDQRALERHQQGELEKARRKLEELQNNR